MSTMYTQMVLVVLVSFVFEASTTPCWARNDTQEIIVGFDIGIPHGTVTVVFDNGSFLDVIRLEAGPVYQAQVRQILLDEGLMNVNQSLPEQGRLAQDHNSKLSFLDRTLKSFQTLLQLRTRESIADDTCTDADSAQSDLEALILGMKTQTEKVLKYPISQTVVTTPSILPPSHKAAIKLVLNKASFQLSSGGKIEDSAIASTIATRFFQRHAKGGGGEYVSRAECLLGPFGLEKVIAVTYTQDILVLSILEIYTGLQTWTVEDMRHFVAIGDFGGPNMDENKDSIFWNNVTIGMRKTAIHHTTVIDLVIRVVLHGSQSFKSNIVSLIQSAFGRILPSPSQPLAVRLIFNEQELEAERERKRILARAFTCYLEDQEGAWKVKDYERDLLRSIINIDNSLIDVEERFLASRGAAIMGLHFADLSCEGRQRVLERSWSWNWDNKRSSTLWYPEGDDEVLEGVLNISLKFEGPS